MTRVIAIHEAASRLRDLIADLDENDELVLVEGDEPVARLVAVRRPKGGTRTPNLNPGALTASPDFDEPLPDSFWTGQ